MMKAMHGTTADYGLLYQRTLSGISPSMSWIGVATEEVPIHLIRKNDSDWSACR